MATNPFYEKGTLTVAAPLQRYNAAAALKACFKYQKKKLQV